jgi:hypothetical protein
LETACFQFRIRIVEISPEDSQRHDANSRRDREAFDGNGGTVSYSDYIRSTTFRKGIDDNGRYAQSI